MNEFQPPSREKLLRIKIFNIRNNTNVWKEFALKDAAIAESMKIFERKLASDAHPFTMNDEEILKMKKNYKMVFLLPIFCYDKIGKEVGPKKYVVASYISFYNKFVMMPDSERVYYEVLVENVPCYFYMDLEFSLLLNKEMNREKAKELNNELSKEIENLAKESNYIKEDNNNLQIKTIVLDSCTEKKISFHIITKIGNTAFQNNYHAGAFMRKIEQNLLKKYGINLSKNPFYFKDKKDHSFYVDQGVYSKDRVFRTLYSSKIKSPAFLKREDALEIGLKDLKPELFFECFIQRIDFNAVIIKCIDEGHTDALKTGVGLKERLNRFENKNSGTMKMNFDNLLLKNNITTTTTTTTASIGHLNEKERNNLVRLDEYFAHVDDKEDSNIEENEIIQDHTNLDEEAIINTTFKEKNEEKKRRLYLKNLIDDITIFISTHYKNAGNLSPKNYDSSEFTITIASDSKECQFVGRQHTNNHIYFKVNLLYKSFHQKCHSVSNNCLEKRGPYIFFDADLRKKTQLFLDQSMTSFQEQNTIQSIFKDVNFLLNN